MAAVLQSFTSFGFASSRLLTPRSPFFGLSSTKRLSSWISLSRKCSSSSSVGRSVSQIPLGQKKVSAKEVQDLVNGERSVPLIGCFYATWCGPCIIMAQELEMLAVEYESNALFVKVDTDDEYEFARDMQVRGLPTLYFISPDPNKDAIRTEGLVPSEMIKNIIDNEM
ncbi:thioredoxin-like protein CITRX2, chloroplastic isoform X2 [Elaeis guineensis]|uniref:Thioredoxin-like protein CITRX, chloroplastic n=1 Tax=Elaeis guineensis var. tenera TaxID=51953 RepID=A0A8N4I9F4_ELAGV|nr:thioredoxin-like protein CITRX2, chloroplastic isoform X2 [Elaeis guineensis]